jgi:sarcosine oxidase subunit beta
MVPDIDGVSVACGFSGHGFMHSPAVGRIMAEAILIDNMPSPDIFPLSLNRFKKQKRETEQVSI